MTLSTSVHDIKALVLSFHPVIVIETVEEDRVMELLASVATQGRLQFFHWSLTQGLARPHAPKGRFDEIFFVDLPEADERGAILAIHLRLRKQQPEQFDLDELVQASAGFSGAELEQAVIGSLYRALHEKRPLDTSLLLDEIRQIIPLSVSRREDIDRLRAFARDRFVSVR